MQQSRNIITLSNRDALPTENKRKTVQRWKSGKSEVMLMRHPSGNKHFSRTKTPGIIERGGGCIMQKKVECDSLCNCRSGLRGYLCNWCLWHEEGLCMTARIELHFCEGKIEFAIRTGTYCKICKIWGSASQVRLYLNIYRNNTFYFHDAAKMHIIAFFLSKYSNAKVKAISFIIIINLNDVQGYDGCQQYYRTVWMLSKSTIKLLKYSFQYRQ